MRFKEKVWKTIMFSSKYMYEMTEKYRLRKAIFLLPFSIKSWFSTHKKKNALIKNDYIYNLDKYNTIKFYLPLLFLGDIIQNQIFFTGDFFEGDTLRYIKSKYMDGWREEQCTIVDVGGNLGNHAVFFSTQIKNAKVYSFEPMIETYKILIKNIKINDLDNKVKVYNMACGDLDGHASPISYNPYDTGGTSIKNDELGEIIVVRLDDMVKDKVDFLKIDVEGFEYNVLLGAKNILNNFSPIIFIEIFEKNKEKVIPLLENFHYKCVDDLGKNNYIFMKV